MRVSRSLREMEKLWKLRKMGAEVKKNREGIEDRKVRAESNRYIGMMGS
jgi:hypothetical protein